MLEKLIKPEGIKVDKDTITDFYGKFIIEPLERGYGTTLGNSLRRVLYSSLEGGAITAVKIEGVTHPFTAIHGVVEDALDIILNLKKVKLKIDSYEPKELRLKSEGEGMLFARDIKTDGTVEIINLDQHILTLAPEGKVDIHMIARRGRGYVLAEENKKDEKGAGWFAIDSFFSPIVKVNFDVQNTRVGERTDYDKLIMEIWTDGSITPEDALVQAAEILIDQLRIFVAFEGAEVKKEKYQMVEETDKDEIKEYLMKSVDELEISTRAANCLRAAGIRTIAELIQLKEGDLMKKKNFGRTSLKEIKKKLAELGLSLGMKLEEVQKIKKKVRVSDET
jgi:DNA-directed RNA polymerase subunit alpha